MEEAKLAQSEVSRLKLEMEEAKLEHARELIRAAQSEAAAVQEKKELLEEAARRLTLPRTQEMNKVYTSAPRPKTIQTRRSV